MVWRGTSRRTTIYWPDGPAFLVGQVLSSLVLVGLVQVGVPVFAYQRGIGPAWLLGRLALSMLGSAVNLPVARLPAEVIHTARVVTMFGVPFCSPRWSNGRARWWRSTSAAPSYRPAWPATWSSTTAWDGGRGHRHRRNT